jgi:hypothetical protein
MTVPDLAALLAPTWQARARAEKALMGLVVETAPSAEPWPEPVQAALRALQPSPQAFLSALVAFWADVSAQGYVRRMRGFRRPGDATWPSLDPDGPTRLFPMTPADPPTRGLRLGGLWVWNFIERIGPMASLVESQLVDCLEHPEPLVCDAAERALGGIEDLSDAAYRRFLAVADRRGRDGMVGTRIRALARHTDAARLALVQEGLVPSLPVEALTARFRILGAVQGALAHRGLEALTACMDAPWPEAAHAELICAIDTVCRTLENDADTTAIDGLLPVMRVRAASGEVAVRSGAAGFLAHHACAGEGARLLALAADPHPWVRGAVAHGLMTQHAVPPTLLRALVASSLGDYGGYDGQPHDALVDLLLHAPAAAVHAMPEILRWWNATVDGSAIERETIQQGLRLCDALAAYTDTRAMLPGLERALAWLTDIEDVVELPGLDQPGAVPILRNVLEADMLTAGTPPAQAAAIADLHGAILDGIAAGIGTWQAEIDAGQDIRDADGDAPDDGHPAASHAADDVDAHDDIETDWEPEPDALVQAVRVAIDRLRQPPGRVSGDAS